jgi:hypothetical protein
MLRLGNHLEGEEIMSWSILLFQASPISSTKTKYYTPKEGS